MSKILPVLSIESFPSEYRDDLDGTTLCEEGQKMLQLGNKLEHCSVVVPSKSFNSGILGKPALVKMLCQGGVTGF